jgi:hypothetical protein
LDHDQTKNCQDNPALVALGTGLIGGTIEAGTAVAKEATSGPNSIMSVDDSEGADGISLFTRWAQENLSPDEMRALADALREAADDADKGGGERQKTAQDSAWRRRLGSTIGFRESLGLSALSRASIFA